MYECRHLFEGDREQLPMSLESIDDVLVHANDVYASISKAKLREFENIGHVEEYWKPPTGGDIKTKSLNKVVTPHAAEEDEWTNDLSAADVIRNSASTPMLR